MYQINADFIDPRFFRHLPCEGIIKNNKVEVGFGQEPLTFNDNTCPFAEKTKVQVFIKEGFFHCDTFENILKKEKELKIKIKKEEKAEKIAREQRRQENKKFNESLNIPVKWKPEIKPVLSGLAENSWGDGSKRNTVYHVIFLEDLKDGRLKRERGDYLCSQCSGHNFHDLVSMSLDDNITESLLRSKVTCKACLKIIKKKWEK